MQRIKTLLVLPLAAILLASCSQSPTPSTGPAGQTKEVDGILLSQISDEAHTLILQSVQLGDVGDFFAANRLAREAVEKDPDAVFAWLRLANVSTSGTEFAASVKKANDLRDRASRGEALMIDMMHASFIENDTARGLQSAARLTELHPTSPRAWLAWAGLQAATNKHPEARVTAHKALELAPDHVATHTFLGNSYLFNRPKDFAKAEEHMQKLTGIRPRAAAAWVGLGDVHRGMLRLDKAHADYTKALELQPDHAIASVKRAHVNSFLGNFEDARTDYDKSLASGSAASRVSLANYRAFVHLHAGQPDGALTELEDLLGKIESMEMSTADKSGARIFALQNIASISFLTNKEAEARAAVERLSAAYHAAARGIDDPDFARTQKAATLYWQGKLAAYLDDYATARAKAKQYAEVRAPEKNPRKMENYHEVMGLIHLRQKKYDKAAEHYRQSNLASLGTGDVLTTYHLAEALDGAGQSDEARALFREVADWSFNSVGYALVRRQATARAGESK